MHEETASKESGQPNYHHATGVSTFLSMRTEAGGWMWTAAGKPEEVERCREWGRGGGGGAHGSAVGSDKLELGEHVKVVALAARRLASQVN